jgi:hypothetical protein
MALAPDDYVKQLPAERREDIEDDRDLRDVAREGPTLVVAP